MKLETLEHEFDELPTNNKLFLALWRQKNGYKESKVFSYGELVELALVLTSDFHHDAIAERVTFNNMLEYDETQIAWEGNEPIESLWYELNFKLKKRITRHIEFKSK